MRCLQASLGEVGKDQMSRWKYNSSHRKAPGPPRRGSHDEIFAAGCGVSERLKTIIRNRSGASTHTNDADDADGNTLSGGGRTMVWDSQNRLVSGIAGE